MNREVEYRRLLEKAQERIEPIENLLVALQKDGSAIEDIKTRVERIGVSLRVLERE